jgi:hypothetical protein
VSLEDSEDSIEVHINQAERACLAAAWLRSLITSRASPLLPLTAVLPFLRVLLPAAHRSGKQRSKPRSIAPLDPVLFFSLALAVVVLVLARGGFGWGFRFESWDAWSRRSGAPTPLAHDGSAHLLGLRSSVPAAR